MEDSRTAAIAQAASLECQGQPREGTAWQGSTGGSGPRRGMQSRGEGVLCPPCLDGVQQVVGAGPASDYRRRGDRGLSDRAWARREPMV